MRPNKYVDAGWVTAEQVAEQVEMIRGISNDSAGRRAVAYGALSELFAMAQETLDRETYDLLGAHDKQEKLRRLIVRGLAVSAAYDELCRDAARSRGVAA